MQNATLLIIQGADQGARFELNGEEASLGRGPQNSVRVHDTEASRAHAVLRIVDGAWQVIDLHSSNGTMVNGRPIRTHPLIPGDQIQIGRTVVLFTQQPTEDRVKQLAEQVAVVPEHDLPERQNIVGSAAVQEGDALSRLHSGEQNLAQTVANLQVLYRIAEEAVRPSVSLEQLLDRILELIIETTGADRGCMLIDDPQTGQLVPQVFRDRHGHSGDKMPVSRTIIDYVAQNRHGVRTSDARADQRFVPGQSILQGGIREAICVPMEGRHELLGVIYLDITTPPEKALLDDLRGGKFTEDLLRLMVAIGRQSALAVEDNRYEQAYVKAERLAAVGQTIAILSHHIKNVLQGIRGGSYLIEMGLRDHNEELIRKGWGIVDKNQGKIYHMVMDMLTFSKERQPQLKRGNLNDTLTEVCELMQARAGEMHIDFAWKLDPDMPPAGFDTEGIHRAVLNVVVNALDAVEGQPDPRVYVQSGHDPQTRTVFVSVSDNGPGIPPDRLPHIFNLFESTKGARGTGIGLAVSQKILREHGGDIVVSSPPGQGAHFTLEWPVIDEEVPDAQTIRGEGLGARD